MSGGHQENYSSSHSRSGSNPLSAGELTDYWRELDRLSGGRLGQQARTGTAATNYQQLTEGDLRAVGGAGATRTAAVDRARAQAGERIGADASLTTYQQQRANQLADQDAAAQRDAINKETEALLAQLAAGERTKDYEARVANSRLALEDLLAQAQIFFGGKGQSSWSEGNSRAIGHGGNFSMGGATGG